MRVSTQFITVTLALAMLGCGSKGNSAGERKAAGETRLESAAGISFNIPTPWKTTPPTSSMRAAQFSIPAEKEGQDAAELVLFYFGEGQGGDTQANIDRWISQMQQPDGKSSMERAKKESHTAGGYKISSVRLNGTYGGAMGAMPGAADGGKTGYRLWCAVIEGPGGPWFFKATGPEKTVEDSEASLDALVSSVKPAKEKPAEEKAVKTE